MKAAKEVVSRVRTGGALASKASLLKFHPSKGITTSAGAQKKSEAGQRSLAPPSAQNAKLGPVTFLKNSSSLEEDSKSYSTDAKLGPGSLLKKPVDGYGSPYSTALSIADVSPLLGSRVKSYDEVPGPKQLPFLGNSWRFLPFVGHYEMAKLDQVMAELHEQYGDVVKVGGLIGHPDLVFVFNPKEIEHVFKREETLPHRPSMPSVKYYKQVLHKDFFGETTGVVGVHGVQWDKFRSQVHQTMMQPSTAKKYLVPLNNITTQFVNRIETCRQNGETMPDFMEELYRWALECIGKVALDTRLGCLDDNLSQDSEAQQMINSVKTFFANVAEVELRMPVWRFYSTTAWKKYIGAFDMFRLTCMKYIEESMVRLEARSGMVDSRLEEDIPIVERILMKTSNPKVASVLALDLLLVGIDTTSVASTTIMYHLAKNPDKQKKLFEELRDLVSDSEEIINEETMKKATYLGACIKEALRMKPVIIGNGRSLQSDAEIGGYLVPKGTHVIFPHYIVGNLPEYFPQPTSFLPERWLKSSEACPIHSTKIHRFASLPFGYGRRTCLGKRFAEIELKILLTKIFRNYEVRYDSEFNYEVQSTYKPSHPVEFQFVKRQ